MNLPRCFSLAFAALTAILTPMTLSGCGSSDYAYAETGEDEGAAAAASDEGASDSSD